MYALCLGCSVLTLASRHRLKTRSHKENNATSFVERRRVLTRSIGKLHTPQRLYMPGVASAIDEIDQVLLADHPERVDLCLPSDLLSISRDAQCVAGLPEVEYRLRCAQATKSLDDLRCFRWLIRANAVKTQSHISNTQRTKPRTHTLFDKATANQADAVSLYRASRRAISALDPEELFGKWKKTFLELKDCDIRGPGPEDFESSQSRFVQSWIWSTSPQISTSINLDNPDLHDALRVEWCKAQEQAKRYEEEVELVVEEMRRTLVTFEWNACEWERRAASPSLSDSAIDGTTAMGIASYAYKQADVQRKMIGVFVNSWHGLIEKISPGSSWLSKYTPPSKDKQRRLVSNVRLYHLDTLTPKTRTSGVVRTSDDIESEG